MPHPWTKENSPRAPHCLLTRRRLNDWLPWTSGTCSTWATTRRKSKSSNNTPVLHPRAVDSEVEVGAAALLTDHVTHSALAIGLRVKKTSHETRAHSTRAPPTDIARPHLRAHDAHRTHRAPGPIVARPHRTRHIAALHLRCAHHAHTTTDLRTETSRATRLINMHRATRPLLRPARRALRPLLHSPALNRACLKCINPSPRYRH